MDADPDHLFIVYSGDIRVEPVPLFCVYFGQEGIQISASDQSPDRIDHHDYPGAGIADQIRVSAYICNTVSAYAIQDKNSEQ